LKNSQLKARLHHKAFAKHKKLVYSQLWNDIMKSNLNEGFLKYVTNCSRSAYVGYSDEIEESISILKRLVYHSNTPENRKIAVESVTTGKEILAKSHKTWNVYLVATPGDYVFKRITGLLESGIAKQWYAFEKRVKSYADLLLLSNIKAEPKKLELNDNIVVVFYVYSVLLSLSLLAYAVEILSLYYYYRVISLLVSHLH